METYGDWKYRSASFELRSRQPGNAPSTHWTGGWVGPKAGLDDTQKWNFLTLPELELHTIASHYADRANIR
jgi:hypothetical protein